MKHFIMDINEQYLEEKFKRVYDKLDSIESQTKKTNGRVTELEIRTNLLEKEDIRHIINCPHGLKVRELDNDLAEYKLIKKYPKVFIIGMVIFGLVSIGAFLVSIGII